MRQREERQFSSAHIVSEYDQDEGKPGDSLLEFPKKDVFMKIDKKDMVFIYEVDDIISGINQNSLIKDLRNTNGEVQVLHNFSRII